MNGEFPDDDSELAPQIEDEYNMDMHDLNDMTSPLHDSSEDSLSPNHIVGTPEEDAQYWEQQTTDFSCAIEAQRGILESLTGCHVSEAELCTIATEHGWLNSDKGTSLEDTGKLLNLYGISTHPEANASVGDILEELSMGHKVIVGVKSEGPWDPGNPLNFFTSNSADHAIWLTGVDMTDPANPEIIVNDSDDPDGASKIYPLEQFKDAWKESDNFYIATDEAPPELYHSVPAFDNKQGVFPDLVDWINDHAPDSSSIFTGVISGRVADAIGNNTIKKTVDIMKSKVLKNENTESNDHEKKAPIKTTKSRESQDSNKVNATEAEIPLSSKPEASLKESTTVYEPDDKKDKKLKDEISKEDSEGSISQKEIKTESDDPSLDTDLDNKVVVTKVSDDGKVIYVQRAKK